MSDSSSLSSEASEGPFEARHLGLQDADTGRPITKSTTKAALYDYSNADVGNSLLKNLVGIVEPAVTCQLFLPNGTELSSIENKYQLLVTYSKLAYAPCIHLECRLVRPTTTPGQDHHTVALNFHFNDCDGKSISEYQLLGRGLSSPEMRFKTTGATLMGFTKLMSLFNTLDDDQKIIVRQLRALATQVPPEEAKTIRVTLSMNHAFPEVHAGFLEVCEHIHSGTRATFPTIGVPEYGNFPKDKDTVRSPWEWINMRAPVPMVPIPVYDTYSSLHEFGVQQSICAIMTDWEGQTELQKLSQGPHKAAVYAVDELAVIALNFSEGCRTRINGKPEGKIRLPDELDITATFKVPGMSDATKFTAYHEARMVGLPPHDAFFIVTSHPLKWFGDAANDSSNSRADHATVGVIWPHMNSFLLSSVLQTLNVLPLPRYERWHPLVLCQDLASSEEEDTMQGIDVPDELKNEAIQWARSAMAWNPEQLKVFDAIHHAKGGIVACTGIAGTGKTTIQMVLAILFVKLGGRALCTAPANSNGDHLVRAMIDFAETISGLKTRIYRVYSASRKVPLEEMSSQQAMYRRAGHQGGHVSNLASLQFSMWAIKNQKKVGAWDCSIENGVLKEAEKGELEWKTHLFGRDANGVGVGEVENVWEVFRACHSKCSQKGYGALTADECLRYSASFSMCKDHLIALADIIITTNGNARCGELTQCWGTASTMHPEIKVKAFGIFMDEVAKEQEVNIWNVLTSDGLPKEPDLVVLFGDPKQLSPVNTCSTKPQYNPFAQLNDVSFMARLITHGFPIIRLTEQQRMHPMLSEFVSSEFYGDELRNASRIERPLDAVRPGLKDTLIALLQNTYSGHGGQSPISQSSTGEEVRLQYIEMPNGEADISDRRSVAIPSHIELFFQKILSNLQWYFGETMNKEVLIICGYGNAIARYDNLMYELRKVTKLPADHYPRILTIDASQGQEATMVIVDGSMQYKDMLGFMKDRGRSDVAMTRAKEVFWVLGGSLEPKYRNVEDAPFVKLKKQLQKKGQVHRMG